MRVAVTGGTGFVAGHVLTQAPDDWTIEGWSRGKSVPDELDSAFRQVDLLDPAQLAQAVDSFKPNAIIHTAAIASIDYCKLHPEEADRVNAGIPRSLTTICAERNIRLIHVSTDNVFEGARSMYAENDDRKPVNYYGQTKVAAEDAVQELHGDSVIARLPLVMGLPASQGGNSFLSKMLGAWRDGESVGVPGNEIRTPVDVITAARSLLELSAIDFSGIIHISGNERVNRLDYVKRIAVQLGFREKWVYENDPTTIPNRAARPLDVSLKNDRARELLQTPMLGVEESIDLVKHVSAKWFGG